MSASISVQGLKKTIHEKTLLDGIDLEIKPDEVVVILGPSGAGKSMLLKTICGLEDFNAGSIVVAGQTLRPGPPRRRSPERVGLVAQGYQLFPHLTCAENITLSPRLHGMETAPTSLLNQVGLAGFENRLPKTLSAGQQQRVAIARALAMKPDILLFDEPTSALDPEMTVQVLNVIKSLTGRSMTMLIVTHHIGFAKEVATRILFIDEGRLIEDRPKAPFFDSPLTERAKTFVQCALQS